MGALDLFTPATRTWFERVFAAPTAAQESGWPAIAGGEHTLIHAPTGSGKTLAAFLWALDRLFASPVPEPARRCRVLYVSPLKALAYDIDRNLRAPLTGIRNVSGIAGAEIPDVSTAMRTGDTPAEDRRRLVRHPPDILITTPESLYLMLTSAARTVLASVDTVIVDEVHSVAANKRGAHLALSLERLEEITDRPPQRIGLSATQRPLAEIARFLGGGTVGADGSWSPRPVRVVDAPRQKALDVEVVVAVEDMTRPHEVEEIRSGPASAGPPRRSIWPTVYPELLELIRSHRSTIVFANSRGLAERIAAELNDLAEEEVARAHHGSVSREQRVEIEDRLKRGELPAVVATSSLELGIDMEAVDLVILVESPPSVASGLQRVGRAGHQVGAPSRARVFPKHRGDLLEAAVVVERMYGGEIEPTRVPRNPLDVLAQQVVAAVAVDTWNVDGLFELARRAYPFSGLSRPVFESVLDMLAGRYPSDEFAEFRPRIVWDRVENTLTPRGNARLLAVTNPGTIPDRGLYRVVLAGGGKVGELDEEMVYESRPGDVVQLGSTAWQIGDIDANQVTVTPAPPGAGAKLPFWHGDAPGRPVELGRALGAMVGELGRLDRKAAEQLLRDRYRLNGYAAANLAAYLAEEREATGSLPDERTIVVERFRDEIGDWRLVALTPYGARVHAPWMLAALRRFRDAAVQVDGIWTDDGMVFRFPESDAPPDAGVLVIDPEDIEELVVEEVADSALFASHFREAAARALLLPRRRPGRRTPLWLQRRRSADLLAIARRYGSFPIVLETYREVLQDHFDLPALIDLLGRVRSRDIRLVDVALPGPSPFASSLLFDFIASFMYEYDAPLAERRATALTLDRDLLQELLGEPELRNLLDAEVVDAVELELQRLTDERRARGIDGLHDLLRDLGPLSTTELAARVADPGELEGLLKELAAGRRVFTIGGGDAARWAAVEDAARLRDALGVVIPPGLPAAFLEPVEDPLGDVVGRFARTHGPFTASVAGTSLGLPGAAVTEVLERMAARGRIVRGAFRPGGRHQEWVDADVLRRLRRRTLAVLRKEAEPVERAAFGRFLPGWHGIGEKSPSLDRLAAVVRTLQGAAVPASILESDVLAARMGYSPDLLDQLAAAGEVVWVGKGALGARDGRLALYLRDQVPLLHTIPSDPAPAGPLHAALRTHLQTRGASFFRDLYQVAGGGDPQEVLDALWDLVWAGEVTNDTLAPLRAFLWGKVRGKTRGRPQMPASFPPAASGRWYLVETLLEPRPAPTAVAKALAEQMLERHGVVTRDAVAAESLPGGFSGLYPVLRALEDAGKARRGYFVEGLGGAQFALAGAVDRLRRVDPGAAAVVLATADPANPFGAALPWPETAAGRPSRAAGSYVVLVDGEPAVYLERGGRRALTFGAGDGPLAVAASRLADIARTRLRRMELETIDAEPAGSTGLGELLAAEGFVTSYKGLVLRGGRAGR